MAMNLHKITAGNGYTYLTRQVAAYDGTDLGESTLADYYSAKGEAPGRWAGSGLAGLGIDSGSLVSERQMVALFGEGLHPDADSIIGDAIRTGASKQDAIKKASLGKPFGQPDPDVKEPQPEFLVKVAEAFVAYNVAAGLPGKAAIPDLERAQIRSEIGRRMFADKYGREPLNGRELGGFITRASRGAAAVTAGYDHTFTVPKSVSALWAIAPEAVRRQIEQAHDTAVDKSLAWLEANVSYTRRGKGGVRQVDVKGLIATTWVHRDSRDGDPHLHTHVAISNKVQAVEDGAWLALDGRVIHKAAVAASEYHNTVLAAELSRMGLVLEPVTSLSSKAVSMEIAGMPAALMTAWSSRHAAITARASVLAREFETRVGRAPSPKEAKGISHQAHLDTRQAKHEPRSFGEQLQAWQMQAEWVLGGRSAVDAGFRNVLAQTAAEAKPVDYQALVDKTIAAVENTRAVFQEPHIFAAAHRQVSIAKVPWEQAEMAAQAVTRWVLDEVAVRLRRPDPVVEPVMLRRASGESVFDTAMAAQYTSHRILHAESAILRRAETVDGFRVDESSLSLALLEAEANHVTLNPGQAEMVASMATSGAGVQLALAPAGSGKTTAMRVFASAWQEAGGNVIGLAPSAAAAAELGDATGTVADTLASLTWSMNDDGTDAMFWPRWTEEVGPRTVLLVDEAGMANTIDLAKMTAFAESRGAQVRLIGDDQQLASISSGGVLRDLAQRHGALTLSELMRFKNPAEAAATLATRDGNTAAIGFWLDNNRVHAVAELAGVDTVVDAWHADVVAGRESLMIAPTRELVLQLNEAARNAVGIDRSVERVLRDGQTVSVGDIVISRSNDRRLRMTKTDYVKNGDRWTVVAVPSDGQLTVRHHGTGRLMSLPAVYVADSVDLGYAVTVHGAQGATVDTCHAIFAGSETRQLAYVATSRGRDENHLYVLVGGTGDEHDAIRPEVLAPSTVVETLEQILGRDGSQTSATTAVAVAHDPAAWLGRVADIYTTAIEKAVADSVDVDQVTAAVESVMPGVSLSPGWPILRDQLTVRVADGQTVADILGPVSANLDGAKDPAAVAVSRLALQPRNDGPLPWLTPVPTSLAADPAWGPYLAAREQQIRDAATDLVAASHSRPAPVWARPYLRDQALIDDLIVWRAARKVEDSSNPLASVTGRPVPASEAGQWQLQLHRRATQISRAEQSADRWAPLLASQQQVLADPYWPVLARRLGLAQRSGMDVPGLVRDALLNGPLPDEHAAAALWWRLAHTLAPNAAARETTATQVRPDWSLALTDLLPAGVGDAVLSDPEWPTLVATVDTAARAGLDPASLITNAITGLNLVDATRDDYITADDVAVMLTWRASALIKDHTTGDVPQHVTTGAGPDPLWPDDAPFNDVPPDDLYEAEFAPPPPDELELPPAPAPSRIVELHDAAAAFYADQYTGSRAAAYVTGRFGTDLTGRADITIGYAPDTWDGLVQHLRQTTTATDDELVDAGLARFSKRGTLIDVFRDRVVLGIRNTDLQLVGFTGRAAPGAGKDVPKYLNTPGTEAFRKGEILYGLAEHTGPGKVPVLAEGAFDAIAITLAGDGSVYGVAPCGTSLTNDQAVLLAAAAPEHRVLVATDQDAAGRKAAEKDFWQLTGVGADPHQLILLGPNGTKVKDPAELYQADQGKSLAGILAAQDLSPHLASTVIASRIAADQAHLDEGNVNAYVYAYRDLAKIIAVLPPDRWEEQIMTASALLGDDPWHADSIREQLYDTATQWNPADPGDPNRNASLATRARNFANQVAHTLGRPPLDTPPVRPTTTPTQGTGAPNYQDAPPTRQASDGGPTLR